MNLKEEKRDKKARRIAFQVETQTERMKSACDDDDDLTKVVVKIIKRFKGSCSRSRNLDSVSTGILTHRRNTPPVGFQITLIRKNLQV